MFILPVFFVILHTILIYSVHEIQHFSIQNKNLKIKIRMKGTISRFTLAVIFACMTVVNALAENSTRTSVDLPAVAGYTLEPGKMYIVQHDMTITATAGNGLNVAAKGSGQAPILYIPADVTLTVKGADASGMTGGGAGIYVPSNAELIITGAGNLVATGGNAGSGENGQNGQNGGNYTGNDAADWKDWNTLSGTHAENMTWSGAGGNGGNGGGGAAAGIGGIGGRGGYGGKGAAAVGNGDTTVDGDGGDKTNGGDGVAGGRMGKVYIMGTVNVTATAGNNTGKTAGAVGSQGYSLVHTSGIMKYIAGAGGGGGGGGVGCVPTYGIGAGAPGAGGGAGGGSGAFDQIVRTTTLQQVDNNSGRASSGNGGKGSINGGSPTSERPRDAGKSGTVVVSVCPQVGGIGGNGGAAGDNATTADNGFLYVGTNATVNGTKGSNPTGYKGTQGSDPSADMKITITLINNEFNADGTKASNVKIADIEATIGDPLPALAKITYTLTATSKYFAGYYSEDNGLGYRIYKGIGTGDNLDIAVAAARYSQNTTLYAHFSHNQHRVNWDYSYEMPNNTIGTISDQNAGDRIKYGKLIFHYRDLTSEEWILDVSSANAFVVNGESYPLKGHTIVTGLITLNGNGETAQKTTTWSQVGSSNDGAFTITLADDKLAQFVGYEFVPMTKNGESNIVEAGSNWIRTTKPIDHITTFSFVGNQGDHSFPLNWTVTLSGLPIYPQSIFVQPMYWNGSKYEVISQTIKTDGVECAMDASQANTTLGDGSSRTYSGTYQVWKVDGNSKDYKNKIGLTGFALNGQRYYLAKNDDGTPKCDDPVEHYISKDSKTDASDESNVVTWTAYNADNTLKVEMTMAKVGIPVLRLMKNADDATLAPTSPYIVVTTYNGTISAPNNTYSATRPGYDFKGWSDTENGEVNGSYSSDLSNYTTSRTVYAVWKENVAPVFAPKYFSYNEGGADLHLVVTDNVAVTGLWKVTSTTDLGDPKDASFNEKWENVSITPGASVEVDVPSGANPYTYFYFKATDAAGNVSYASSGQQKTDGIAPTYNIYPERNVCNFYCELTIADNIALDKIYIAHKENSTDEIADGDWEDKTSVFSNTTAEPSNNNKKYHRFAKPTADSFAGGTGWYSLKVTDVAGNETVYENFVHMIYDHNWDVANPHKTIVLESDGTYTTHTYYDCLNGCEHVWDETVIGAAPNHETNGYKHKSDESDPVKKQHQEQGLMRAETLGFLGASGTVVITNTEGNPVAVANTINEAIGNSEIVDGSKIILADNTNVGANAIATPADNKKVTIDLDGYGLKVNNADAEITGDPNVTILLNDNGGINYTNGSTVTNTPIAYKRNFAASTRAGKWQALYLPFAVSEFRFSGYDLGTAQSVSITSTTAELKVTKGQTSIEANTPYFIRSSDGKVDIDVTSGTLSPYSTPSGRTISKNYTIKGSLTDTDNAASADKAYWVLTNGGTFTWAKADSHQRPYHWVIYDNQGTSAKALSMIIVEEEATGINAVNKEMKSSNAVYTLDGRKVNNIETLAPGMYIIGSKKIVIK